MNEQAKNWWDIVIKGMTLLALIIGGLFSGFQYLESQRRDRIDRTMEYLRRTESTPFTQNMDKLHRHARSVGAKVSEANDVEKRQELANRMYAEAWNAHELRDAFNYSLGFYTEVATCIETGICERDVALALFSRRAQEFFFEFSRFLCKHESNQFSLSIDDAKLGRVNPSYAAVFKRAFVPEKLRDPCRQDFAAIRDHMIKLPN